jgi:formylglycine-generating enzyme required for sulfatase activity
MIITPGHSFTVFLAKLPTIAKELLMLWIPPGTFMMGSPENELGRTVDDEPQFEVTLSKGFWLGQYTVTQAQWQTVMGDNPSYFSQKSPDLPVEGVNWYQAISFCEELNKAFAQALPKGYRFSLPTEAQWEYACRAGTQTIYHNGNSLTDLWKVAWHGYNSSAHTHPVGEKEPNAWGLFDMHGNVFEWCYDFPMLYPKSPTTDWVGKGGKDDANIRSMRGGAWPTPPEDHSFRCSCRSYFEIERNLSFLGFRLSLRSE